MRTPTGRVTGHGDSPIGRYGTAKAAFEAAVVELIGAGEGLADSRGEDRTGVAEGIRLICHRAIDQAVDKAVLTYPSPTGIVPRTASYHELQTALRDSGVPGA